MDDNNLGIGFDEYPEDDELETLFIIDEETEDEIELFVLDKILYNGLTYFLVIEAEAYDDDEAPASILKRVEIEEDFYYETIEDDGEFEIVAKLFKGSDDDFELEI